MVPLFTKAVVMRRQDEGQQTIEVKLASLNVRSVKSTALCVNDLQYQANTKADGTFLQECGCYTSKATGGDCDGGPIDCWYGWDQPGNFTITEVREVVGGLLLMVDVMYHSSPLRLINAYGAIGWPSSSSSHHGW